MKLASLLAATKSVDVPFGDQVFQVHYRPAVLTVEFIQGDLSNQSVESALVALLAGWDLQDEDGNPLPIDAETVQLPEPIQGAIIKAVTQDTYPNL